MQGIHTALVLGEDPSDTIAVTLDRAALIEHTFEPNSPNVGYPLGKSSWDIDVDEFFVIRVSLRMTESDSWSLSVGPGDPIRPHVVPRNATPSQNVRVRAYEVACLLHDALIACSRSVRWSLDAAEGSNPVERCPIPPKD